MVSTRAWTQPLVLAGFAVGLAAVPFIARSEYLVGLALILGSRLLDELAAVLARLWPRMPGEAFLARVLEIVWSASLPFGFALAEPGHALAAMFLLLGLVARAAALTPQEQPTPSGVRGAMGFGSDLVGNADLSIVYAVLCLFPHWFSFAAYALGIACFAMTGFRVAKFGSPSS
jgi:hypothetical protein